MVDEPQAAPVTTADESAGTSSQGQAESPEVQSGVPNDPAAFQADYTRKYQELSKERETVQQEKARIETEKAAIAAERQRIMAAQQQMYTPQYTAQPDPLVDQFGTEGAAAIKAQQAQVAQGVYQQLFAAEYARQEELGRSKYGTEAWGKFDYIDPTTGQRGNQIMDLRCKGIELDRAWRAVNDPPDLAKLEQEIKDKVYAEIKTKGAATPASGTTPTPSTPGVGHAKTTAEAFEMALSQLSGK